MGSRWHVTVAGQDIPVWGKSYVPDELMLLFTDADRFVDPAKVAGHAEEENRESDDAPERDGDLEPWNTDMMGYATTAGALRQRLELHGFSADWVCRLATAFFDDEGEERDLLSWWPDGRAKYPSGAAITAALTTRTGRAAGAGIHPDRREEPERYFLYEQWQELREAFDDPRFALALSLSRTRSSTEVRIDLTDLVQGGWLMAVAHPHREARLRMSAVVAADAPIIVVTEGSSDAHRLRRALEVSVPDVAHIFTFLDFELRPPGGTDRVVALTKGMAAAGIMNRIVAVLDNDTAGREAAAQLTMLGLPAQVVTVVLPDVTYACSYPTRGPSGHEIEDVNGRAASMEFMFGADVLRDESGELAPVRWHSFNAKIDAYQGRLDSNDKIRVGKRIDEKLAKNVPAVSDQVRQGCDRLAAMLITAAAPPKRVPASEGSVLSELWRRDPFADIHIDD